MLSRSETARLRLTYHFIVPKRATHQHQFVLGRLLGLPPHGLGSNLAAERSRGNRQPSILAHNGGHNASINQNGQSVLTPPPTHL